jgi:hypothetical protein
MKGKRLIKTGVEVKDQELVMQAWWHGRLRQEFKASLGNIARACL